jgi:hypothetical protein
VALGVRRSAFTITSMTRHVAYVEAHGARTPQRLARQRAILDAVGLEFRPLPERPPHEHDELIEGFAFPKSTTASEALARLVGILDSVDREWRDYVRAWDGYRRNDGGQLPLADPPYRGLLALLQRIFNR